MFYYAQLRLMTACRTIINHIEKNNNVSFLGLIENAFNEQQQQVWFDKIEMMEFYKGETIFGDIPREQAWIYNNGGNFGDRANWKDTQNPRWIARPYTSALVEIQHSVQKSFRDSISGDLHDRLGMHIESIFDSILINKYRGPNDSIKAHRDSEIIFGNNPTVVILSLGCPREIVVQRILYDKDKLNSIKRDRAFHGRQEHRIVLPPGSLLIMGGELQKYYSHEIKKVRGEDKSTDIGVRKTTSLLDSNIIRYSLTFRQYMDLTSTD